MKSGQHSENRSRIIGQRILLVLFAAVLLFSIIKTAQINVPPLSDGIMEPFASGWDIYEGDQLIASDVTLPYKVQGNVNGKTYTLKNVLPDTFPTTNASLSLDTSLRTLEVFLDGESIYYYGYADREVSSRQVLGASFTHFIRLPDSSGGHEISLEMKVTSYNQFAGIMHVPTIGQKADQVQYQMRELPNLVFGLVFLFTGIVCALISLSLNRGRQRKSMVYFGWIMIALGAWLFSQNCTKFIFIPNAVLALNFSYAALYLLPFFLIQYVRSSYAVLKRITDPFLLIAKIFIGAYIAVGIGQFFGLVQFSVTLQFAGLGLLLFILGLFIMLLIEFLNGNKDMITFLAAVGALLLTVLFELVLLLMSVVLENALVVHAGMGISGAILLYHSVRFIGREIRNEVNEKIRLNLVNTDALTGAGNRTTYEARVAQITSKTSPFSSIGVLMVDVNDLKAINDTYGRNEGDLVLKDMVLEMMSIVPGRSEVYRVGGDEFMVLIESITYEQMSIICTETQNHNFGTATCSYTVACGYSFYVKESEKSFEDVTIDADAAMYDCKAALKRSRKNS